MDAKRRTDEFHYKNSDGHEGLVKITYPYRSVFHDNTGHQVGPTVEMPFIAWFDDAVWAEKDDTERLALWLLARSASDFHRRSWAKAALQSIDAERTLLGE